MVRRGISLVEILIVLAVSGILAAIATPAIGRTYDRLNVQAATRQLAAAVGAARAASLQKGRPSRLRISSTGMMSVTVDTNSLGNAATVISARLPGASNGLTVTPRRAADSLLSFDARGFVSPRLASNAVIVIAGTAARDSICVGRLGQILDRGCTL